MTIYMPMAELESSVELLHTNERSAILTALADWAGGHGGRFIANYWKDYPDWLRLYGRAVLMHHYAESDKRFVLIKPEDEESITIWDYFHQPIKSSPAEPWFVRDRTFNLNQRGLMLRRNWPTYAALFSDLKLPPVGFLPLVPGKQPGTWIIDEVPTDVVDERFIPKPWKDPEL